MNGAAISAAGDGESLTPHLASPALPPAVALSSLLLLLELARDLHHPDSPPQLPLFHDCSLQPSQRAGA